MDTKRLRDSARQFLTEIGDLCSQAQTEEQYEDIVEITQDLVEALPRKVIILDYYTRQDIKNNIPDEKLCETTQFIDSVIDKLCVEFPYDDINDYISETAEGLIKTKE